MQPVCPTCLSKNVAWIRREKRYYCKRCGYEGSREQFGMPEEKGG